MLPLKLPKDLHPQQIRPKEPAATRRRLQHLVRRLDAWMNRASHGRLRVEGQIAPMMRVSRRDYPNRTLDPRVFRKAMRSAQARGLRFGGAIPVFVATSRMPVASHGGADQVLLQGHEWYQTSLIVHELGHALGLLHAKAPSACPRPFRPLACANRPRIKHEYGDDLDVMGYGGDRFGAYPLAVLGLAPVQDAPSGRARLTIRPLDRPQPTLLRLRTARHDWLVDSRIRSQGRTGPRVRMPRGVAISRVPPRYRPSEFGFPPSERIPATNPQAPCRGTASCHGRQIFRLGRSFTVPGAFRLRVLRGRGPVRVETTWLDRTPPTVAVARTTVVRRFGTGNELVLDLRADARGAGVARVEIDHGGVVTRIDADDVPGLVAGRRGQGRVRVPLIAGAAARVWLVDAAGNASPPVAVDLAAAASASGATIDSSPAAGSAPAASVQLADGQTVTVSGATDPAFAGQFATFQAHTAGAEETDASRVTIGADGRFSITWTPPEAGRYDLTVRVPVEPRPDNPNPRIQSWHGSLPRLRAGRRAYPVSRCCGHRCSSPPSR